MNKFCNNITVSNNINTNGLQCSNSEQQYITFLKRSFPSTFDGSLGKCTKFSANLKLKEGCIPVFRAKRPVAYNMRTQVETELRRLENLGIISPITHSDWAAPIVVKRKANGEIRICADFSTGLNDSLESQIYPLPLPEDIFAKLNGATFFSHIDLSHAFFQLLVNESSKGLLVINTHLGLFEYNRLYFGVKTAPTTFQQGMDELIAGLEGVAVFIDDIFVSGKNKQEHDRNLIKLFQHIQEFGLQIKLKNASLHLIELITLDTP